MSKTPVKGTRSSDEPGTVVHRTRWQDAALFGKRNWLGAVVLVLVALAAAGVLKLIHDQQTTLRAQCDRGNVSRPETIDTDLDIARGNRKRAEGEKATILAWQHVALAFPPTAMVAEEQIQVAKDRLKANRQESRDLTTHANNLADAQIPVSLHPNAEDPRKRAIVDCAGQF